MLSIYLMAIDSDIDKSKFEQIYIEYRDKMYYVAKGILSDEQDAENIVHDTFLTLIDNLENIYEIKCHKTWNYIVTILKNKCFNHIKRRKRALPTNFGDYNEFDSYMPYTDDIANISELADVTSVLTELIQKLPFPYKEVLYLQYFNELSGEKIAVILGKTPENIRQISKRAKKKLEKQLTERGYNND